MKKYLIEDQAGSWREVTALYREYQRTEEAREHQRNLESIEEQKLQEQRRLAVVQEKAALRTADATEQALKLVQEQANRDRFR